MAGGRREWRAARGDFDRRPAASGLPANTGAVVRPAVNGAHDHRHQAARRSAATAAMAERRSEQRAEIHRAQTRGRIFEDALPIHRRPVRMPQQFLRRDDEILSAGRLFQSARTRSCPEMATERGLPPRRSRPATTTISIAGPRRSRRPRPARRGHTVRRFAGQQAAAAASKIARKRSAGVNASGGPACSSLAPARDRRTTASIASNRSASPQHHRASPGGWCVHCRTQRFASGPAASCEGVMRSILSRTTIRACERQEQRPKRRGSDQIAGVRGNKCKQLDRRGGPRRRQARRGARHGSQVGGIPGSGSLDVPAAARRWGRPVPPPAPPHPIGARRLRRRQLHA